MTDADSNKLKLTITVEISENLLIEQADKLSGVLTDISSAVKVHFEPSTNKQPGQLGTIPSPEELERKIEIQSHFEERKKQFVKDCVQAFRIFRRIRSRYETLHECYQAIACRFNWPVSSVPDFIRLRRSQVWRYQKKRRVATILRLHSDGLTYSEIGERLDLNSATVGRLARQARSEQRERSLALEGATK